MGDLKMRHPGRALAAWLVVAGFAVFLYQWQPLVSHDKLAPAVDPNLARDLAKAEAPPHVATAAEKRDALRQGMANRIEYARLYETRLLDNNMNVDVTTSGEVATTLTLKWILVSKVTAHQMEKDEALFSTMRLMGFKRFIITDGYRDTFGWNF
jgi:hypothetical protein